MSRALRTSSALLGVGLLFAACGSPDIVTVPELVGMPLLDARDAAAEVGLDIDAEDEVSDRAIMVRSNWAVRSQDPPAGAEVDEGTTIALGVVNVYDDRGSDEDSGNASESPSTSDELPPTAPQSPRSETPEDPDDTTGDEEAEDATVETPPFVGTLLSMARDSADNAGVRTDTIDLAPTLLDTEDRERAQFDPAAWVVIGQCPSPGEPIAAGDRIWLGVIRPEERNETINIMSVEGQLDGLTCDLRRN